MYCINPSSDEPIMLLNKHIGYDAEEGQGIDGSLFQSELLELDNAGKKRIQIWINSPGGSVMEGMKIYDAILKSKTKVDTYNCFMAASIAAVIFQAGRKRTMADYAMLMYHDTHGGDNTTMKKMKEALVVAISGRTGVSAEIVSGMMTRTTWMTAEEAFANGFCTDIESSAEFNKKRMATVPADDVKALWSEGNKVLNSAISKITPQKIQSMKNVNNKLGLVDDANETSILSAIDAMQNKAKAELLDVQNKLTDTANKLAAVETEKATIKAELETVNNKLKETETAKVAAETATKAEACKNMLTDFAKVGRITADSIPTWTETANSIGVDKVKAMIEALPLNKVAPVITENKLKDGEAPTNAVSMMVAIAAKNKAKV